MKTKYSITVKNTEKELYHIFKDLERHGRATFSYPDNPDKQARIARDIGMRGKKLINKGMFYPPARAKYHNLNIIAIPPKIKVVEIKKNRFHFDWK